MSSIIRDYIFQADAQGRYLDPAELERIKSFVNASERRLRAAQRLTDHREWIIIQAATLLFQKQPDIVSPDGNAYAEKMTASCLRDLDYYLRIVTYGIVAGDVSFLEEIGLIGIRETYSSLGTPLSAVAEGVFALRTVANSLISTEDANEAGVYFDYIINCIDGVSPTSRQAIKELFEQQTDHPLKQLQEKFKKLLNSFANTAFEGLRTECGFWEPSSYIEWLKLDKLAQQIQRNGVNDKASFEASAKAFFESWRSMPGLLRRTVWREREIMAALLERLSDWEKIAGFAHIGVAKKQFGDQEKLAGILTFKVFAGEYLYEKHNIPRFVKVESLLSQSQDDKLVPILLESVLLPIEYSSLVSPEAADIGFQSPCLQSGDVIVGRNSNGRFNEGQTVTLTTFVVSQDPLEGVKPQIMSVRHGFKGGYTEINVYEAQLIIKVGQVFYKSPYQQEKAENLDISLINLEQSFELNPFLKWTEAFPGNPFPTWSGMLVQMYGGASGHVVGYVNHSMIMSSVAASSIVPSFTAIIPSQPGDSGSLLVAGNHSGDPLPDAEAKGLDSSQVEKLRFAMLGMLVAGAPSGGSYTNLTYFTPMIDICQQLRIKPYLSMKSSIVKIEQPASISQSQ